MSSFANWDIVIKQGSTFRLRFTWYNLEGVPRDLTGYAGRLEVRKAPEGTVLHFADSEDGNIVFDDQGHIDITIPASNTETPGAPWVNGVYDLFLFPTSNRSVSPFCIAEGKAKYRRRITDTDPS